MFTCEETWSLVQILMLTGSATLSQSKSSCVSVPSSAKFFSSSLIQQVLSAYYEQMPKWDQFHIT